MKEIGIFTASYNRNTKKLYTEFTSTIKSFDVIEEACEKCDEEFLNKKAQQLVANWFTKMNTIEEADIAEHPIQMETIETKNYTDGSLKSRTIRVFQN